MPDAAVPAEDVPPAPRPLREPRIRPLAIAVLLHRDHLLAAEGYDAVKGETFYRPLGGEIEFGETAAEAAVRELREETGLGIVVRSALGVTENHFMLRGEPGHEIVFEFVADVIPGSAPADLEPVRCLEGEYSFTARWLPLAEVLAGAYRLYPDGLVARLVAWVRAD